MSRIGKMLVKIPDGVEVSVTDGKVKVSGPKGIIEREFPPELKMDVIDGNVRVSVKSKSKMTKAIHGTFRAHVNNMVKGVSEGWIKKMELVGSGYKAEVKQNELILIVGYSHPVPITIPEGVNVKVEKNIITLEGVNKEVIGQLAAQIRKVRPPEPYKGKGILYLGEEVRRKLGKAAAGTQGAVS